MIGAHRNAYVLPISQALTQDDQAIFDRFVFFLQYPQTSSVPTFFEINSKLLNPDFRDSNGKNAFLLACENGNVDVLNHLKSASPNSISTDARDLNGYFALHCTVRSGNPELVKWLSRADIKFLSQSCRDLNGRTPKQLAIIMDKKEMEKAIDSALKSTFPFNGARATGPRAKL